MSHVIPQHPKAHPSRVSASDIILLPDAPSQLLGGRLFVVVIIDPDPPSSLFAIDLHSIELSLPAPIGRALWRDVHLSCVLFRCDVQVHLLSLARIFSCQSA